MAGDDRSLIGYDLLQQRDVVVLGHRHVSVAAHAERDDALIILVALDALFPECIEVLGIGCIVPGPIAMPLPFLLRAQHRLVVRGAHHDAIFVSEFRVQADRLR